MASRFVILIGSQVNFALNYGQTGYFRVNCNGTKRTAAKVQLPLHFI